MNRFLVLPVSFVALVGARPLADVPRFTPRAGASVVRTLEMKGKRDLTSLNVKAGDEEKSTTEARVHVEMGWKLVVQDEFKDVSEGRVEKLARTFATLAKSRTETSKNPGQSEEKVRDLPETCALQGQTVEFAWNAKDETYEVKAQDAELDVALLAGLECEMDYQGLLPQPGAETGAKWHVDFARVKGALLRPAGDLPFQPEKEAAPIDRRMRDAVWDATQGRVDLELAEAREEDGVRVAVIAFTGQIASDAGVDRAEGETGPAKLHAEDAQTFEGELLWDLAAGRPHALSWSSKGTLRIRARIGQAKSPAGDVVDVDQTLSFDEEFEYTARFKSP